jgi:hypothetical protein
VGPTSSRTWWARIQSPPARRRIAWRSRPRRAEVDVLDARGDTEARELEEPREPAVGARRLFALEQEGEAILEAERGDIGHAALFLERGGHAGEAERVQEGERLFNQHARSPPGAG